MKKALLAAALVIVLAGLIWWGISSSSANTAPAPTMTPSETPTLLPTTSTSTTGTEPNPPPAAYNDGTYTGDAENAVYGVVQVAAVINGGKLTAVNLLQYPNAPGHTTEVNQNALPQLQQEALAIQSANVDIVSGATQTSEAFQASLKSALAQAAS